MFFERYHYTFTKQSIYCSSNDTITPLQSKAFIAIRTIPLHLYKAKHLLFFERYHYTFTKQSIYCYSNDTITPLQSKAFIVIRTIPLHLYKAKHLLLFERYHYTFTKRSIYCYSNDTITPLQSKAFIDLISRDYYDCCHEQAFSFLLTSMPKISTIKIFTGFLS